MVSLHCFLPGKTELVVFNIKNGFKYVSSVSVPYKPCLSAIALYLFGSVATNTLVLFVWADMNAVNQTTAH